VNRPVTDHGKFVGARRDKDEHGIAIGSAMHPEAAKLSLRREQRIAFQVAAPNENADLSGGFCFGLADRLHNPVVLQFTEEFFRSHWLTNSSQRLRRQSSHLRR